MLELISSFRYGIRAFDTSAYYGPSEIVLGNILESLREEFPRSSYQLVLFFPFFALYRCPSLEINHKKALTLSH